MRPKRKRRSKKSVVFLAFQTFFHGFRHINTLFNCCQFKIVGQRDADGLTNRKLVI